MSGIGNCVLRRLVESGLGQWPFWYLIEWRRAFGGVLRQSLFDLVGDHVFAKGLGIGSAFIRMLSGSEPWSALALLLSLFSISISSKSQGVKSCLW